MLYYLFRFLRDEYDLVGAGVFQYITFRALLATVVSVLIATIFGKKFILYLQKKQIGETIRDLDLAGQMEKKGTPTMGGLIILLSVVVPVLLFARLSNVYIVLLLITLVWTGSIGFLDDYIKKFKNNKDGLAGKFKIVGQVGLGLCVGITLLFNSNVTVREFAPGVNQINIEESLDQHAYIDTKSTITTIPFVKENEFNYSILNPTDIPWITDIIYVLFVIFIITAVSNGANITDGLDGLTAGTSAIIVSTLALMAYFSGNFFFAQYLNVMYIPYTEEVVIFATAFVGACIGFLWYNSFPAQVFMGDTGSLSIGSFIAVLALIIRKELLIPVLCGVFLIENLSVMMQVVYFKYTKRATGEGKRLFLMSPLHHHYQKKNIPEPKIVTRFWIVGVLLALASIITLKVR
jgi:phospho-N-acetylmuramoyl-pentapeptide-transferase